MRKCKWIDSYVYSMPLGPKDAAGSHNARQWIVSGFGGKKRADFMPTICNNYAFRVNGVAKSGLEVTRVEEQFEKTWSGVDLF